MNDSNDGSSSSRDVGGDAVDVEAETEDARIDRLLGSKRQSTCTYVTVQCQNPRCLAIDQIPHWEDELDEAGDGGPLIVVCWKCGAGRKLQLDQMRQKKAGMVKVAEGDGDGAPVPVTSSSSVSPAPRPPFRPFQKGGVRR